MSCPQSLLSPAAGISAVMVPGLGNTVQRGTVQHTGRERVSLWLYDLQPDEREKREGKASCVKRMTWRAMERNPDTGRLKGWRS